MALPELAVGGAVAAAGALDERAVGQVGAQGWHIASRFGCTGVMEETWNRGGS